jgi:Raf kinase inhibitor-like YbhB/YbcL family protein
MYPTKVIALLALAGSVAAAPLVAEEGDAMGTGFAISSRSFATGQPIPAEFTADGANVSPQLDIADPPAGTTSFALIVDDPDAPMGTWVHWVVWNIPADTRQIGKGHLPSGAVEGRNSWGRSGYGGPSPPSGTHRYLFKLYAVDGLLQLPKSTDKAGLLEALEGKVLGRAQLVGTYTRR